MSKLGLITLTYFRNNGSKGSSKEKIARNSRTVERVY